MEYGGGGGGSGGDDTDPRRRRNRYHRHTAHQIQRLEGMFNECPHPDEKTRMQLSRELGLAPRQIKFWFQNRRTQMKAQHERADNSALRAENDRIRCENIAIREALKNLVCPSCGPHVGEDSFFDEQKLRIENAQLKEELDRVASIAAKYIGRPISQLPLMQPIHLHSLDLSMASFGGQGMAGPSLDLFSGSSLSIPTMPFQSMGISDMDKSVMASIASNAMDELIRLLQSSEPIWMKSTIDGRDVLNLESYESIFPGSSSHLKNPNVRVEASRDSGVVAMNVLPLVDMFMNSNKWVETFPTIITTARTIEVISSGLMGSKSGTLQLMYEELQVLSPLVPTRQLYFLRFCQQIDHGSWALVDVSYDLPQEKHSSSQGRAHRLPSGCLIQDMPNGYSKVIWMEHMEIEDKVPIHRLYRDQISSGLAFGAERWLSTLQRSCERFASQMVTSTSSSDLGGVTSSPDGKRSMMRLAHRMVNNFCSSINPPNGQQWTSFSGTNEFEVRATLYKCTDHGQTNSMILSAATTIWLPISPQNVFSFFKDERTRPQWDVLADHNPIQEIAHIANGSHPGNCISVLRTVNTSQNNTVILQESCIDTSGSLVVYCPIELHDINMAMNGEDPSYIPLLPSGFTISPDGRPDNSRQPDTAGASTSTTVVRSAGSLVTVVIQILVSSFPLAKLSSESLNTVNNLISNSVEQIKAAFNCPTS